ncbi:hypothetical protein NT6N_37680 [Oceaniferula spumae]|uniref:Ice-binding protein C-terminal domain-containing protein n=1 Tax=Oceaniferula spumae TaxID=2979115 RepID=A0AAT9FS18_9BACT
MKYTIMATALAVAFGAAPLASHAAISVLKFDETKDGFTTSTTPALSTSNAASNATDNQWGFATPGAFADAGVGTPEGNALEDYVWVAQSKNGSEEPNVPDLAVSISGLNLGTSYNIYGYYVVSDGQFWGIRLGLDGGGFGAYFYGDGTQIGDEVSGTRMERVLLGTVDSTTTATVDVSQLLSANADYRSIVKGVGIEAIPEPSSAALLGLGGLALILRRRK